VEVKKNHSPVCKDALLMNVSDFLPFLATPEAQFVGRAIAQAVSQWLPTMAARVRVRVWSSGICGGKVALEQVFFEYFDFPCQSSFYQILHPQNHPRQVQ
jgi:hypothetical protein